VSVDRVGLNPWEIGLIPAPIETKPPLLNMLQTEYRNVTQRQMKNDRHFSICILIITILLPSCVILGLVELPARSLSVSIPEQAGNMDPV
jgi:hypothetical protein